MMRGIQETNKKVLQRAENSSQRMDDLENLETSFISEDRELVVLSQDVKALYPSIKKEETIKIVGKLIEETEIEFDDVDYKCLGKYLAVHLTPEEIANNNLISVIPARRKEKETQGVVRGRKPGIAYLDSDLDANKNEKWDWKGKRKNPTKIQKKKMIARTMEIIVDTIMSNHYYQFGGKVFKQVEGGPIGLEITGVLARLVMLWWDGKFLSKLGTLGIDLEFYLRYVDDSNMSAWALTPGTRFVDGQLSILEEFVGSDKLIPADKRTASVLRSIANEILPGIVMQEDVPSNHPNEKLPILDIEVWVSENRIYHSFYKKPMATKKVVHAKSALPTRVKRSILLEEGSRRLRNCSPELEWEDKVVHLNRLSSEMKNSGHSESFRRTILQRVVSKYENSLSNHQEDKVNMYRTKIEREDQKKANQVLTTNDTWFRKGGYTSTLTVPPTPGGRLASSIEGNLGKGRQPPGTKTKVIEGNGLSSCLGLTKNNQFPREECDESRRNTGLKCRG